MDVPNIFDHTTLLKMARETLQHQGHHAPMLFIEDHEKRLIAALLIFRNDDEKDKMRQQMRTLVQESQSQRYWMVMEAWIAVVDKEKTDLPMIRPSRRLDRKEVLMIQEYTKELNNNAWMQVFTRTQEDFVFEDVQEMGGHFDSAWNFYVEEAGYQERADKNAEEINTQFMARQVERIAKKYHEEFRRREKEDGSVVAMAWLKTKISEEAQEVSQHIAQNTLEDPEKTDDDGDGDPDVP